MMLRTLLMLLVMLLVMPLAAVVSVVPALAQERVVNVYNWSDYIDTALLAKFERETGIHVRYDVYDSLETLEAKLFAGHSGYDVIVPSAQPTLARLIKARALLPLDASRVASLSGLDPALMRRVASADPGNRFGAIYLWGSTGLGFDPKKVAQAAPDAPLDSWDLLFKPENARRLKGCGIIMMDSAIDVVPTVLAVLHRDPDSTDAVDLALVEKTLMAIRPSIRTFANGGAIEQIASGEACLAFDYSGDVIQASLRARARGVTIQYVAPREGAQLSFDMLAVPKDAPHPAAAMAFIDFILRPENMAATTNAVHYANAIPASLPMVNKDIADDPGIYPPPAIAAHFFEVGAVPPDAARTRARMWARFKAAH